MFDLNICAMQIESEQDFTRLRQHMDLWHKRFPMFRHDVISIENIVESHIKQYSIAMVYYRQSHKKNFLEDADRQIAEINRVVSMIEKLELMALLSQ